MSYSYTVIAKEEYNYSHTEIYCLGIFSSSEKASQAVTLHKIDNNGFDYHIFDCREDECVELGEDDSSEGKDREKARLEGRSQYLNEQHLLNQIVIQEERKQELERIRWSLEETEIIEISQYKNEYTSKNDLLQTFNKFLHYKELKYLYSTNNVEYYQSNILNIIIRYNKLSRTWSEVTDRIIKNKINETNLQILNKNKEINDDIIENLKILKINAT
jgi:hypothetical protein